MSGRSRRANPKQSELGSSVPGGELEAQAEKHEERQEREELNLGHEEDGHGVPAAMRLAVDPRQ